MTEVRTRETHTTDDLLAGVREGVEEIVRAALAEAASLREEADEKLAHYDNLVNEATRLRSEIFGPRKDIAEIPARLQTARLDAMVQKGGGDDAEDLQRRYVQARERSPVAEARLSRLEDEVAFLRDQVRRQQEIIAQQAVTMRQLSAPESPQTDAEASDRG